MARPKTPWEPRFLNLIDARSDDECWPWMGYRVFSQKASLMGYGQFTLPGGIKRYAHRIAYEMFVGPVPEGLQIRHTCDNPPCCNPAHMVVGTSGDNHSDMIQRGRSNFGERHWNVKLTAVQVEAIRADTRTGIALAAEYGVHKSMISRIRNRKRWKR